MTEESEAEAARAKALFQTLMAGDPPLDPDRADAALALYAMCSSTIAMLDSSERHCRYWLEQVRALRLKQTEAQLRTLDQIREGLKPLDGGEW